MADKKIKTKKKNRKLLVQVSLITFLLFLVSITVISISSAVKSFDMYYDSKVNILKQSKETLLSLPVNTKFTVWLLDYIKKNNVDIYWMLSEDDNNSEELAELLFKLYGFLDDSKGTDDVYEYIESPGQPHERIKKIC